MSRQKKQTIVYWGTTFLLMGIFLICMKMTVWGGEDDSHLREAQRIDACETVYMKQLKGVLAESGYTNCGITLTKVYEEDGSLNYTVLLHHFGFKNIDSEQGQSLLSELSDLAVRDVTCHMNYEFCE